MPKLTKRVVEALRPAAKDILLWDSELPGFGVRVKPGGVRSYLVQYRNGHRSRRLTLGRHGVLTAEQARRMAQDALSKVRRGEDPMAQRAAERAAATVAELAERYLKQHAEAKKKPASQRSDRFLLRRHILPALGRITLKDLTRADVTALHHALRATPYVANRALALLSKMFALAVVWGVLPDAVNPCRGVEKYREHKRQRFLSEVELARLGAVWREIERENVEWPTVVPALRLALFTGARIGEVLGLRWEWVDFGRCVLDLPDSKTGAKMVHLRPPSLEVLKGMERKDGNPFVFYGRKPGAALVNLKDPWQRIRRRAEMPELRIHDLRHSFASMGAGQGASLPMIGALLGHTQASTTARYAHLAADPLRAANDKIGSRLAAAVSATGGGGSNVVQLERVTPRGRRVG